MSLHLSKSQLSNPLLAGRTPSLSGTAPTKRKASGDYQARQSVPIKQKSGGTALRGGSSPLTAGSGSLSSGLKLPLMENKLLSSPMSLGLQNTLSGNLLLSGSGLGGISLSQSLTLGSLSSRPGLGETKLRSSSGNSGPPVPKAKKVKSQPLDVRENENVLDSSLTTCQLPSYNFTQDLPVVDYGLRESEQSFDRLEEVGESLATIKDVQDLTASKQAFINAVSASLIGGPNFHDRGDAARKNIKRQAEAIARHDPEFILKVALYTRKELNIRTTANFLLALAAMTPDCRPFLRKYFAASVFLPSDWIDVAELYQTFHDKNINYGSLPSALRKAMADRFPQFDQYQLAKYNKQKKKNKPASFAKQKDDGGEMETSDQEKDDKASDDIDTDGEQNDSDTDEEELERLSFTLKQLIRKLHLKEPVDSVMCLLGKRYPEDMESFYQSRLPGTWDPARAGKRMKLPTPETWETQVSLRGNKATVWEELIDHKKLPFMAMLRNLRNMISAGISEKHHKWVLHKLTDRGSVVYSKQFPFRFFSAYEVLQSLEKDIVKSDQLKEQQASGRPRQPRGKRARKDGEMPLWKRKKLEKKLSELPFDASLLNRYRKALDTAVKIATSYNVKPIPGKTLILCHVGQTMEKRCTSARGLGKPRTVVEVGVLLGLMCKYSCEDCSMIIYAGNSHRVVELESGTILENMESVLGQARLLMCGETATLGLDPSILGEVLRDRVQLDNLVILSDGSSGERNEAEHIPNFLGKYRQVVNGNLLYVDVNLTGAKCNISKGAKSTHPNDIFIAGYSDQILRFIAERGDTGQVTHVENIDKAYGLDAVKIRTDKRVPVPLQKPLPLIALPQIRRSHVLRVFISSTFRDMHGERDLLTRFVFPELRAKARSLFVKLYEVDLRWGVNEEQTRHSSSVEICLREANRCDLFLGILGDRYGYVPNVHPDMGDDEDFAWLPSYPRGRSITELEMHHKALRHSEPHGKAFFYIRSSDFLKNMPNKLSGQFEDKDESSREKLASLKRAIRTSGYEVYDEYPCQFGGVVEGKPVVVNLEEFGRRVINNVWNYIKRSYPEDGEILDEINHVRAQHDAFLQSQLTTFTGRKSQAKQCLDAIQKAESGIILISGKSGCGKTALVASVADTLVSKLDEVDRRNVLVHFVGAVSGSAHVVPLLRRLCNELQRRFNLQAKVPQEYKNLESEFPNFLGQAAVHVDSKNKLVIFIDGINGLDPAHQAHNLDWLPHNVPESVVFVLSASSGSPANSAAVRRQATVVELGPLDLLDKAEVVRRTLASHHKTLDESPFNNQMKLLISKREANLPLFLKLACEELRMFGVFEEVSTRLKSMSHTISSLLQEVLKRLEDDHGEDILSTALTLLVSTRDGLFEEDLHHMLSLHTFLNKRYTYSDILNSSLGPADMIPQAVMARLVRGIKSLLAPTGEHSESRLKVTPGQISQAIVQRYLKGAASETQQRRHDLLAGYFTHLGRRGAEDRPWSPVSTHALTELPYHLAQAGLFRYLHAYLTDPFFIEAKCLAGLSSSLLEDYQANTNTVSKMVLREREKFLADPEIQSFRSFLSRHIHVLALCPQLLWQQAENEPDGSVVRQAVMDSHFGQGRSMVAWTNKRQVADECSMTVAGFTEAVLCVAIAPGNKFFAVGTKRCQLKLYELATGKELKNFVGHSDAVTSCCFVGQSRLVSASRDTTLSLWDVDQGYRVNVLKGHKASVSGCISDPAGVNLASCGWDCRVLIWDGRSGKKTSDITESRPINCLSYHPDGNLLITGSWDSTLKIWDTFNKKRVAILRGHQSSVRAVVYSPTGRHIASAALDGAVKLWSANTGTQVGSLCGHSQPINNIAFSHSGKELVTVSDDHKIKIWSGNLGKQLAVVKGQGKIASTQAIFSPDGKLIAVGYHSGEVKVMELTSRRDVFTSHRRESRVRGMAWCSDSEQHHLVVGFESGHLEILTDISSNKNSTVQLKTSYSPVTCVAYSNRSHTIAACYEDLTVSVWPNMPKMDEKRQTIINPSSVLHPKCNGVITCCAFDSPGTRILLGTRDAMLFVYKVENGKVADGAPLHQIHNCHKDWINSCSWSLGTNLVATASNDSTVKLWDVKTGKEKAHLKGHGAAVYSVAFSHGCIVSGCLDASVKVWSHRGVEITTLHGHSGKVNKVDIHVPQEDADEDQDFDEDYNIGLPLGGGNWEDMMAADEWKERHDKKKLDKLTRVKLEDVIVASASDDGTTRLWKPLQANELTTLIGHSDRVLSVSMASTGQVVTTSLDQTVKVWTPLLSPESVQFGAHNAEVTCVALSTKTSLALTASRNGTVCLWDTADPSSVTSAKLTLVHSWKAAECSVNAACFVGKHKTFLLGLDDGTIVTWKVKESKDGANILTTEEGKTRYLNNFSFVSMRSPVTHLLYDDAQDTLHVGTWGSVVTLRNLTSGRLKQNTRKSSDWVLDLQPMTSPKGMAASLANGTVVFYRENSEEVVEVAGRDQHKGPTWQCSLTPAPSELENAHKRGLLTGSSRGDVACVAEDHTLILMKKMKSPATCLGTTLHHIVTASSDGTVKLWSRDTFNQVGQFFCQSPVTSMSTLPASGDTILCGDQLGNVYLLDWKKWCRW